MINSSFLRKALLLSCLFAMPLSGNSAAKVEEAANAGVYGRIFQLSKVSGETNFMDTGRHYHHAVSEDVASLIKDSQHGPLLYHDGGVFGDYRPTHALNMVGGGFALGYRTQNARFEFEGIINGEGKLSDSAESQFYGLAAVPAEVTKDGKVNGQDHEGSGCKYLKGVKNVAVGPMNFSKFSYAATLFNIYQDIPTGDVMKLYVGGGVGISRVTYNLTSTQNLVSTPFVAQGKVGVTFDVGDLGSMGMVPYLGYSALYFAEKEANSRVTGLTSHKMSKDKKGPCDKKDGIPGLEFAPVAKHLLHNIEFGVTFSLDA
ncbi:hypothetical protein NHE_0830 [Neorickettsia helminthoeca str. Oregon]|uniref:Surface antigen family protein n=1 Tax=Neorickettsia helminthoeca str. Oregon TaxID=1286528 RepID=X5GXH0_9RICK|nr:hypothetical protein [Neorickettsia helminthoeca]AHX11752.1 hypothetical protein NHE_0830 [Neorickettsia helminthoeca str. Oregon]